MTFKAKSGINVGAINIIDSNSKYQQALDFPSVRPTLSMDLLNQTSIDSRFTFTRASSATYVNEKGLISYVGNNVPRFEYDRLTGRPAGLLIESQRVNYAPYSSDFTWSSYTSINGATVWPNQTMAPDGSMTAAIMNTTASTSGFYTFVPGLSTATVYTQSIFVKNISGEPLLYIGCDVNPTNARITFNSLTGVVSLVQPNVTYYSVVPYPNGWWRVSITFTTTSTAPSFTCYGAGGVARIGVWGFQMEAATNIATSYIPSTDVLTSRASSATYQDSVDDLIKYAGVNFFLYTSDMSASGWGNTNTTRTQLAAISPSGAFDANAITETTGAAAVHETAQGSLSVTSGTFYTVSVYVKANGRNAFRIGLSNTYGAGNAYFNLALGTVSSFTGIYTNASITSVGNGWYRCTGTFVPTLTGTGDAIFFTLLNDTLENGGTVTYAGNGASGILMWGAQVELGSFATLVSLTGATATAAARPVYNPNSRINTGLLNERNAATNLIYASEDITNASYWAQTGAFTSNATVAPDGRTTADYFAATSPSGTYPGTSQIVATTAGSTYTISLWMRKDVRESFVVQAYGWNGTATTNYLGEMISTGTIVDKGWVRYSGSFVADAGTTQTQIRILFSNVPVTWTGTQGMYIWGVQCELGAYASSYIPTTTGTATRAADITTSSATTRQYDTFQTTDLSWYRQEEGTYVVDFDVGNGTVTPFVVYGPVAEMVTSRSDTTVGTYNGSSEVNSVNNSANTRSYACFAMSYGSLGRAMSLNGANTSTGAGSFAAGGTTIRFCNDGTGGRPTEGHLKKVTYYPIQTSNTQVQALSRV